MAGEWEQTTLADVSADVAYGYTESASDKKVGPRFLRITDIQNGVVDWNTVPYCPISESDHRKYRLLPGDIVVARTGNSTGENYLYRDTEDAVYASYLIRFRVNQIAADPAFVWYNMRTQRWQDFIDSSKTGSAQAGANAKVLGLFPLSLPPLAEQKAIASVLGALDDKIELNRRMNGTLEAMARALFQSWFVDFDPVRAKLDGRQPANLDPATAALFPDSFEHHGGDLMPHGWKIKCTADLFEVRDGTHDSPKRHDSGFPLITSKHIKNGGVDIANAYLISEEDFIQVNKRSKVDRFDTLMTMIGTVGVPLLVHEREPNFAIKNIALFKTSNAREFSYYFYLYLDSPEMQQFLESRHAGTTQAFLSLGILRSLPILVPDSSVMIAFNRICEPLFDIIGANRRQTETLATLRETLLPKLLSGELSVPTAEAMIEDS